MRSDKELTQLYIEKTFTQETPLMLKAKEASQSLGLDRISVSAMEGRLLQFLIKSQNCQKFVEVGTLTGYSSLWIAQALGSKGTLWTLEKELKHAQLAEPILKQSGYDIQVVVGDARETLKQVSVHGPFDGIFIDGNKAAYCDYLDWAEAHVKKGGLIIGDNTLLGGTVVGEVEGSRFSAKQVEVMRQFNQRLGDSKKYLSTMIPTEEGLTCAVKVF